MTADLAERQAKLASLQGNNPVQSEIQVQNPVQNPPTIVGQNQPVVNQPVVNQPTVSRNNRRELEVIPMIGQNGYTEIPNSLGYSFKIQAGHKATKDSPRYYGYGTAIAGQSATGSAILGMNFNVNKQNANIQENVDVIVVPTGSVVTVNGNVIQ